MANEWNFDMSQAPRDNTLLLLIVEYQDHDGHPLEDKHYSRTIGSNNFHHDGNDEWQFAGWSWKQDCFTEGAGTPVAWMPLPEAPPGFDS